MIYYTGQPGAAAHFPEQAEKPVYLRHRAPEKYAASPGLTRAVNAALILGQPLLVTGEPGTGKTQLAYALAHALHLGDSNSFRSPEPHECFVRSATTAQDLFYTYDDLGRFRDSQPGREPQPLEKYVQLQGLGLAILHAGDPSSDLEPIRNAIPGLERSGSRKLADLVGRRDDSDPDRQSFSAATDTSRPDGVTWNKGFRSVVLIDELDKAPRDTPNDMLNWIERMSFEIPELGVRVRAPSRMQPVVVIASNSEKSLPDAFLRRCVYYDIPFPDRSTLIKIVTRHYPVLTDGTPLLEDSLAVFDSLRGGRRLRKPPATAELLAWLGLLLAEPGVSTGTSLKIPDQLGQGALVDRFLPVLVKTREDLIAAESLIVPWRASS